MVHIHWPINRNQKSDLSKSYIDSEGFQIDPAKYHPTIFLFVLLLILACILLFTNLTAPPIYIVDEARNAQCAKEMMQHHNWIIPTFNGQLRPENLCGAYPEYLVRQDG